MTTAVRHPATYSHQILTVLGHLIDRHHPRSLLDPFAGTGVLKRFEGDSVIYPGGNRPKIYLNELEPEWAEQGPASTIGDALQLPYLDWAFDMVMTSPCYGNRMADHHDAQDGSHRTTYRHTIGRPLHPQNSGQLQWGPKYREFHRTAWQEVRRVLRPGGLFVLNVSDHIRAGKRIRVSLWHRDVLETGGFRQVGWYRVQTPRMRYGQNYKSRVATENVYVFEKNG